MAGFYDEGYERGRFHGVGLICRFPHAAIYRTIILPVVLYGCETGSLTLREKRRIRAFESRVLREMFVAERDEVQGSGENCIVRSLTF